MSLADSLGPRMADPGENRTAICCLAGRLGFHYHMIAFPNDIACGAPNARTTRTRAWSDSEAPATKDALHGERLAVVPSAEQHCAEGDYVGGIGDAESGCTRVVREPKYPRRKRVRHRLRQAGVRREA
jgi:hypothetical protein